MDGFEEFYRLYPRKAARKDAQKAWQQIDGDTHLADIVSALEWQCQQPSWKERDAAGVLRWVPLPASYLRGERWTDECPAMLRAAVVLASESPEERAARRARVEAETAERWERAEFEKWKAQGHPVFAPYATFEEFQARRRSA